MFNSAILDVAVGVMFVFILVSTLCSAIREGIEAWLKTRASYLEYALRELLHDRKGVGLAKAFFEHPLIYSLYLGEYRAGRSGVKPRVWHRGGDLPSYIPSRSFALVVLDIVARGPSTDAASSHPDLGRATIESMRASVENIQNPAVQRVLLSSIDAAEGDLEALRGNIEAWYDGAMDRVSGWYKRSTQWVLFIVALLLVGALNVNTLTLVDHLYRDPALRSSVVAAAEHATADTSYQEASKNLEGLRLPIGWEGGWGAPKVAPAGAVAAFDVWGDFFQPVLGLLITALAATLGAPFWFDLMNKVMVVRSTLKPLARRESGVRGEGASPEPGAGPALATRPAGGTSPAAPPLPPVAHEADACDRPIEEATPDEELPPAQGGVEEGVS